MTRVRERMAFLKTFKSDARVAALAASSRFVVRDVMKRLPQSFGSVIECGPGEGVMTRSILTRLQPDGKMLAIETNPGFVEMLKKMHEPRLRTVQGRAQDMVSLADRNGMKDPDLILASIPFSFLKPTERMQFVRDACHLLAPRGTLVIFHQYSPLTYRPMKKIFGNAALSLETRNLPPCFIMVARKER